MSDISIGLGAAIPLAQLINELLSNSFKHAFRGDGEGSVDISLTGTGGEKGYTLIVSDDGSGFPDGVIYPNSGNLGFQLIDALIKQLRGKLVLSSQGGGFLYCEFHRRMICLYYMTAY